MRAIAARHPRGRPQCAGLVALRRAAIALVSVCALAAPAFAQSADILLGEWRGESKCLVRPSACNDEVVVYEITTIGARSDSINIKASKIVRDAMEYMGDVQCHRANTPPQLECPMSYGTWRFRLDAARTPAALTGELYLPNGVRYRAIIVRRSS